ncbi:MAG: monovalent cation/H+ antiporter subunit D family protein [Planctomycetota bacterium]|nr:MAG: monovalent cation/H+ antiporter subunit D family protein [Planctomycetota bacterium]
MHPDLPALQIVVPLLSAPVCVLLRRPRLAWAVAMAATWFAFGNSIVILRHVLATGPISYALGGFPVPYGIELSIDSLNALVLVIVTGISAIVLIGSPRSLEREVPTERHYLVYTAYLLCMTGLLGMTITGDAFNIFVFLEISSLSSYSLISMGRTRRAVTSAFQYLVMGTIGGTFILLGIGLLYMVTGTLNLADMSQRLAMTGANRTVLVSLAFIVAGTSIKLAVFPLHIWLPNAYTFAPAIVTAFLAATATKVAFYILARFVYGVYGVQLAFGELRLDAVLLPLALLAMFVASTVAIFQRDVKRMLAYSSVAQVGYMLLGMSLANVDGLTGGIVHLFNHALIKSGLFLVMAVVLLSVGSTRLDDMRGLGRKLPLTMAAFVLGGLGLIGVPGTAGFVSKWYLILGALEDGLWPVAVLTLLSSLLAVVYVWRVIEVAYFQERPADAPEPEPAPASLLVPAWALLGASVWFGVFTSYSAGVAREAAEMLLGGGR